jgi:RNA polymerase sigma-70 factor, ECF subfamily
VGARLTPDEANELAGCFKTHAKALFGYACLVTRGDTALADDLVQQAFQAAAAVWPSLRDRDGVTLRAWLRSALRNIAISDFRRNELARRKLAQIEQRYRRPEADTCRDALTALTLERCWQAIRRMPERQSQIALMYWRDGMKSSEIAEVLDIAAGTVSAQISRARAKLLAELKDYVSFAQDGIGEQTQPREEGGATA